MTPLYVSLYESLYETRTHEDVTFIILRSCLNLNDACLHFIHVYIYIYVCVCVCMCVCERAVVVSNKADKQIIEQTCNSYSYLSQLSTICKILT